MAITLFGKQVNIHPRFGNNFLDANALDSTGSPEDAAMEEILQRADAGEFTLLLPYSVQDEIAHPNTPTEVKRKAQFLLFSMPVQLTEPELATHQRIRSLIQGNAQIAYSAHPNAIPAGSRTAFRSEGERRSERSDAGTTIVQKVFGFVK